MKTLIRSICLLALFSACQPIAEAEAPAAHPVLTGLEVLLSDSLHLIEGKRIGLVTNQTGVDSRGRSGISLLFNEKRTQLSTLFAPEHGIDGSKPAGQAIGSGQHAATGLPIVSLYSGIHVVDPGLFKNLDMVLVDLQDVGIRPYTYISTMDGVMVACGKANIPCLVLDRPNPIGGNTVGGEVLDPEFRSFIGVHEIPYLHGMTMGELARLFQGEFGSECDLTVVPMRGWQRGMNFARTGLPWIPTSPNVPTAETPLLMALTGGIGELGGVSIGIGTALPFRLLGQDTMDAWDLARRLNARTGLPWIPTSPNVPTAETPLLMALTGGIGELGGVSIGIGTALPFRLLGQDTMDAWDLARRLNARALPGLQFLPWSWTPSLGGYKDRLCQGVYIHVEDFGRIDLAEAQWALLDELYRGGVPGKAMLEGKEERFRMYDKAMGSSRLRRELPKDPKGLAYLGLVRDQVREFRQLRKPYLLYPED